MKLKGLAWLLILCLALTAAAPAMAEESGFTVEVSVPQDFEGELNGRLLFMFDAQMPEEVFDNLDVT